MTDVNDASRIVHSIRDDPEMARIATYFCAAIVVLFTCLGIDFFAAGFTKGETNG